MRCLVYVVGASSGIGRATAALFSRLGANVMLTGRNQANLQETCDTCQSPAHMVTGDMTNESDVENIINETISKLGRLDILVSCLLFLSVPLYWNLFARYFFVNVRNRKEIQSQTVPMVTVCSDYS